MTPPPHSPARLLAALGARVEFRDPLLGDLAEEFAQRLDERGPAAARRWYLRESLRAAPHLLHDWLRELRSGRMLRQAGLLVTAYAVTSVLMLVPWSLALGAAAMWGLSPRQALEGGGNVVALTMLLAFMVCGAVTAGYVAARLDARAPLASALLMGTVWWCVTVTASVLAVASGHDAGPAWYRIVAPLILLACTPAGAVVRLHRHATPTSLPRDAVLS